MALARTTEATQTDLAQQHQTITGVALASGDLLYVSIALDNPGAEAQMPSAVTWNGISLTKAIDSHNAAGVHSRWAGTSGWYLQVASGATASVVITTPGVNAAISTAVLSYTGFDTGAPIGDTDSTYQDTGSGIPPSCTLTTAVGDEIVDTHASADGYAAYAPQSGQTEIYSAYTDQLHTSVLLADATSETVSWNSPNDYGYCYQAVVIKNASGGGASVVPILNSYRQRRL